MRRECGSRRLRRSGTASNSRTVASSKSWRTPRAVSSPVGIACPPRAGASSGRSSPSTRSPCTPRSRLTDGRAPQCQPTGHSVASRGVGSACKVAEMRVDARMTRRVWVWIALACAVAVTPARAVANGEPPPSPVALALVAQMTLDEKLTMVHGTFDPDPTQGEAGYLPSVPRLGVPPLRLTDGPAGVRVLTPTTAMPAPISLAASFSRTNALDYGAVLGRDARARNQD